jgi:pre-mRNA-processing factor 19
MLEVHTLKQSLNTTRKELSQALYQHEAACRVIARLLKERNEAREKLAKLKGIRDSDENPEEPGIDERLKKKFDELSEALSTSRASRKVPNDWTRDEDMAKMKEEFSATVHTSSIISLDISSTESYILTGGKDCKAELFNIKEQSTVTTFTHLKKITAVTFLGSTLNSITCSSDGVAKLWEVTGSYSVKTLHSFNTHTKSISSCAVHPDKEHCLFFSKDGSWSLHNFVKGGMVETVQVKDNVPIFSGALHPDGLIIGTGLKNGAVMLWDIRSQQNSHNLEIHNAPVKEVGFSEKGYQMVTLGKGELGVRLWDLRKLSAEEPLLVSTAQQVNAAVFDSYGVCLGLCAPTVEVYKVKGLQQIASIGEGEFTAMKFGAKNRFIVGGTADGQLKFFT